MVISDFYESTLQVQDCLIVGRVSVAYVWTTRGRGRRQ